MAQFAIEHLSTDRLLDAWPVILKSHSHANADWWVSEATAVIQRGGGILAARGHDGAVHGVATYEIARNARLGRVLAVGMLITFELRRGAPARQTICDALALLAAAFDCRSVLLPPSSGGSSAREQEPYTDCRARA